MIVDSAGSDRLIQRLGAGREQRKMSSYLEFPDKETLLERLRRLDYGGWPPRESIYESIATRLADRTLESAAFSFILIELLHRQKVIVGEELWSFLPKCVLALTEDEELARSARAAFEELGPPSE
jgi:hypothetical protein